jgi:NADH:ubiquinone oxidoreductase subunit C
MLIDNEINIKAARQSVYLIVYFLRDCSVSQLDLLYDLLVYELKAFNSTRARFIVAYYLLSVSLNYRTKVYTEGSVYQSLY